MRIFKSDFLPAGNLGEGASSSQEDHSMFPSTGGLCRVTTSKFLVTEEEMCNLGELVCRILSRHNSISFPYLYGQRKTFQTD